MGKLSFSGPWDEGPVDSQWSRRMVEVFAVAVLGASAEIPAGGYFSLAKIIIILLLVIPWLLVAPWIQKDAKRLHALHELWSGSVVAAGAVGVLLWLVIPYYIVGLLAYVFLAAASIVAYLVYRDSKVDEEHKILRPENFASLLKRNRAPEVEVVRKLNIYGSDAKIILPPNPETTPALVIESFNLLQDLLFEVLQCRVSEIDLMPAGQETQVRRVIDGVVSKAPSMPLASSEAIIQYLKPIAGLKADERRRPQEGRFSVDLAGKPVDIMVATAGTTDGQRLQLRVTAEAIRTDIDTLGMSKEVVESVRRINASPHGLIIVSGKHGMGVTSTLYSLLRAHDAFVQHLVTLEQDALVDLENITQNEYHDPAKLPDMLASAVRRDPNVVMVDRCPDAATAEIICQAAESKLVLLGVHAPDSFSAMTKWLQRGGNVETAMKDLLAVTCQVLLRKLCLGCREAYRPDPQLLVKANVTAEHIDRFYRPPTRPVVDEKGRPIICPACQGSGYVGRVAAFELLEVTDEVRQAVIRNASQTEIKKICRRNRMLYLQEQALRKVIEGDTSVQEVLRVSQEQKK